MTDNPFAAPAEPGAGFTPRDHEGRLLYIEPLSYETSIKTTYGDTDAVRADIVVIDGDNAPDKYPDSLIFPSVLVSQVKGKIGEKVLGRLTTGIAKPGQSAPWKLAPATPEDVEVGKRYLAYAEEQKGKVMEAASQATSSASESVSTPF